MALPAILGAAARLLGKEALKGAVKNKIKGAAKDKITKGLKGKAKKITKDKLMGKKKDRGGPLALRGKGSSSIVPFKAPKILEKKTRLNIGSLRSSESKGSTDSKTYAAILKEIQKLNKTFSALKKSIASKNASDKKALSDRRKQLNIERKRAREEKLESKKIDKESGGEGKEAGPQLGIFEIIKRFFSNILIGGLLTLLLKNQKKVFKGIDLAVKNWRHITRFLLGPEFRKPFLRLLKFTSKVLLNPFYLPGKILKGTVKLTGKAIKTTFSVLGKSFKLAITGIFKLGKKLIDAARAGVNLAQRGLRFGGRAARAFSGALRGGQGIKGATQAVGTTAQRSARQAQQAKEARQAAEAAKKAKQARQATQAAKTTAQATKPAVQAAQAAKGATQTAGTVAKAARRSIRIPIIGPLLVALDSWLSGDPPNQTLFKAGGAAIGGLLGNFIPIPVLGMMLGEYIGEYVGNLFYYGLKTPGGWKKAGDILWNDLKRAFDVGKTVMDWLQKGVGRYVNNWPKMRIPNPAFPGPVKAILEASVLWKKPMKGLHQFLGGHPISPFKFISDNQWFGNKKGEFSHIPDPTFMIRNPIGFLKHVKNSFLGTSDKKPDYTPPDLGPMNFPSDGSGTPPETAEPSLGQRMDVEDSSNRPTSGSSDPYSIKLAKLLANYEGIRENAYPDAIYGWKVPTIGIGATYYPKGFRLKGKVKKGDRITKEEAYWIKSQHIIEHRNRIFKEIGQSEYNKLPDNVKAAVESKAFNYGSLGSTLSNLIKEANKTKDYSKISSYFKNTLAKHDRGTNSWRRNDEAGIIDSGKSKRVGVAFGKGISSQPTPGSPSPPASEPPASKVAQDKDIKETEDPNRKDITKEISAASPAVPSVAPGQISSSQSNLNLDSIRQSSTGAGGPQVGLMPIPMGGNNQYATKSRAMLGQIPASPNEVLNSYYRLQLLGFLYKQG